MTQVVKYTMKVKVIKYLSSEIMELHSAMDEGFSEKISMTACSVVLVVCFLSGSGSLEGVLTSSGGLLLSRESRDFKFNLHLNSSIFNITFNITSTDLEDGNELMQGGENMLVLLDAGDFCLSQVN